MGKHRLGLRFQWCMCAVLLCFSVVAPSRATVLAAGSPLSFNLDFTGAPSYTAILVQMFWTPALVAGQNITLGVYGDPDGVGLISSLVFSNNPTGFEAGIGANAEIDDGIFSIVLSLNSGSVDVTSLVVSIGTSFPECFCFIPLVPPVTQTLIPTSAVPVPATLALIALGLAGAGIARRRRLH